ncbi:hypothetical protein EDD86DRAFT_218400 [Gorgonomyces haynaldii]|nr:hypothetical protein EDD86DRAFT_218400 [Gorgonomyces haynaldii]
MVKEQLIKTRKMYADRTTAMLSVLPPGYYASCSNMQPPTEESSYSLSAMTYADVFQSIMHMDIKQQWNQPPIDEGEQLFVFLQRVSNSIWRGDYITGMVYLTPLVWTQPGVRLVGIETKTHELGLLLGPLQRLKAYQESDPDCQNLVFFDKAIEEFEPVMEQCKQQIFKKFKYQDEKDEPRTSTNSNRLRTLSMRIQKSLDVFKKKDMEPMAHYRTTLASFLGQSADIFLRWLKLTHDPSRQALHIKTRLLKIVSFYDHVVYPLVVNDIQILVERFIKKMRKEASI